VTVRSLKFTEPSIIYGFLDQFLGLWSIRIFL